MEALFRNIRVALLRHGTKPICRVPLRHGYYSLSKNHSGFTLIEIIAVLLIIGVMTAIAMSSNSTSSADIVADTDMLKMHIRYAQMKAMTSPSPWGIKFNGNTYSLLENGVVSTTILPGADSSTATLSAGNGAVSTVDPLVFNEWGSPGNATITVNVSGGGDTRPITVTKNTGFIP